MAETKNESLPVQPLQDEELAGVAGGILDDIPGAKTPIYGTTWSYCGYYNELTYEIYYYPCSKCGTPMYTQKFNPVWICDCCDNKEFSPVAEVWTKSREQLISDALY